MSKTTHETWAKRRAIAKKNLLYKDLGYIIIGILNTITCIGRGLSMAKNGYDTADIAWFAVLLATVTLAFSIAAYSRKITKRHETELDAAETAEKADAAD